MTQGVRLKSIQDAYNCDEAPLEKREEEANVVFTGTVRHLYPDNDHPNQMKAQVEIKRVMKGNNIIRTMPGMGGRQRWQRRLVYVDRIGDPDICDSYARKFDTRIFLTDKGENGELKLKSSLVRLTLNNLDRADAAVKGKYLYLLQILYQVKTKHLYKAGPTSKTLVQLCTNVIQMFCVC